MNSFPWSMSIAKQVAGFPYLTPATSKPSTNILLPIVPVSLRVTLSSVYYNTICLQIYTMHHAPHNKARAKAQYDLAGKLNAGNCHYEKAPKKEEY